MTVAVVPPIDARAQLDAERRHRGENRLHERTAQTLRSARRYATCECATGRARTGRAEIDFVEIALVVAEIAADAERLEAHHPATRPLRRGAPVMTGNVGGQAAVFRRAATGTKRGRTLRFGLHDRPNRGSRAYRSASIP